MNNMIKKINTLTLSAGMLLAHPEVYAAKGQCTQAATIAKIVDCVVPQLVSLQGLIMAIVYLGGISLGIKGVLKLKEVNEKKGQVSIVVPICIIAAAALLLALPTMVNLGMATLGIDNWTGNADSVVRDGQQGYIQFKY